MTSITNTRLLTNKDNVGNTRVDQVEQSLELKKGEAILSIDTFALTTNNITYAAFGESMNYWEFFPTGVDGWGHMPVWGYATVSHSAAEGLSVGDRFYGYYPIANTLKVQVENVTGNGFKEVSEHRQHLPFTYNAYMRIAQPETTSPVLEDAEMLMRPLFYTSWMLADFLVDNDYFGAKQVVFSSASSKTAYGTAYSLHKLDESRPKFIALTSDRNRAFVDTTGLYDESVAYENLSSISKDEPTIYVDFSGSNNLRRSIHQHFAKKLVYNCYAGSATNTDFFDGDEFDPKPTQYFAPIQIRKRIQDWGSEELTRRYDAIQKQFLTDVINPQTGWMTLSPGYGFGDAGRVTRTLFMTGDQPNFGRVIRFDTRL